MIRNEEVFNIGRITKPHGIGGEVELAFTNDAFDRGDSDYLVLSIDGIKVPFFWEEYRFKNNDVALFKFEDIDSDTAARRLAGCEVFYPFSRCGSGAEPTSWSAFVGYRVWDDEGHELGQVEAVDDSSANVLFTIRCSEAKGGSVLVPVHPDLVVDHDYKKRTLVLAIPAGLLSLND